MNQVTPADFFKTSKPAAAFAALDPSESLAEGIGSSYGVIGYKGKVLTLRLRGEVKVFTRPDDGTPMGYLDVIILRAAKVKAKSYYLPGTFDEASSAGKRPICASIDGVTPDKDVLEKQSDACVLCPRNEWRTDANGKKSRECADYKRLAVLILPSQTTRLLGAPLLEPVFLRIPPASLNDLAVFGETMSGQGWPFSSFVTRISFDQTLSHPKFIFRALQGLGDAEAKVVLGMREEMQAKRITGEDQMEARVSMQTTGQAAVAAMAPAQNLGIAATAQAMPPQPEPPAQVTPPKPAPPAAPAPSHVVQDTGLVQALANPSAAEAPPEPKVTATVASQVIEAFATEPQPEPAPTPAPGSMVGQTADDVGDVTEDKSLDDQINALLAT
jgi:hypothetical protein